MEQRIYLNVGCGERTSAPPLQFFESWREIRLDLDPGAEPDIVASLSNLDCIRDESFDALFSSHSLEHLFAHELPRAVRGFQRILKPGGFACVMVPDIQVAARAIVEDKLTEPLYRSRSGPVTPHDMVFGFGAAIARGSVFMAHRCGFTPTVLGKTMVDGGFAEVVVRRRELLLELAAVGLKTSAGSAQERAELMESLRL